MELETALQIVLDIEANAFEPPGVLPRSRTFLEAIGVDACCFRLAHFRPPLDTAGFALTGLPMLFLLAVSEEIISSAGLFWKIIYFFYIRTML